MKVKIFDSWCHQDRALADALLRDLLPALGLFRDLDVGWWQDSRLTCGEELEAAAVGRIDECDYGLLLLSARYFSRPFIRKYELPRFAGPKADRGALPVALNLLPGYGARYDLGGVEHQVVFTQKGKSYAELTGHHRVRFANDLAETIRRRVLGDSGYRAL